MPCCRCFCVSSLCLLFCCFFFPRIVSCRSTMGMESLPYFTLLFSASLWLLYGILRVQPTILLPNVSGVIAGRRTHSLDNLRAICHSETLLFFLFSQEAVAYSFRSRSIAAPATAAPAPAAAAAATATARACRGLLALWILCCRRVVCVNLLGEHQQRGQAAIFIVSISESGSSYLFCSCSHLHLLSL